MSAMSELHAEMLDTAPPAPEPTRGDMEPTELLGALIDTANELQNLMCGNPIDETTKARLKRARAAIAKAKESI